MNNNNKKFENLPLCMNLSHSENWSINEKYLLFQYITDIINKFDSAFIGMKSGLHQILRIAVDITTALNYTVPQMSQFHWAIFYGEMLVIQAHTWYSHDSLFSDYPCKYDHHSSAPLRILVKNGFRCWLIDYTWLEFQHSS